MGITADGLKGVCSLATGLFFSACSIAAPDRLNSLVKTVATRALAPGSSAKIVFSALPCICPQPRSISALDWNTPDVVAKVMRPLFWT